MSEDRTDDEWLIIPLFEGWMAANSVVERRVIYADTRDEAIAKWHKTNPYGVYGAILKVIQDPTNALHGKNDSGGAPNPDASGDRSGS